MMKEPDYKKLYFRLFSDVTDAIADLADTLSLAEELYLSMTDENPPQDA